MNTTGTFRVMVVAASALLTTVAAQASDYTDVIGINMAASQGQTYWWPYDGHSVMTTGLVSGTVMGYVPQDNWNNCEVGSWGYGGWWTNGNPVDQLGLPAVGLSVFLHPWWDGGYPHGPTDDFQGSSNPLLHIGYEAQYGACAQITGIPFATYDIAVLSAPAYTGEQGAQWTLHTGLTGSTYDVTDNANGSQHSVLYAIQILSNSGPYWPNYLPADFNKDGEVGPEDVGILKDNFGLEGLPHGNHESWTIGDANDDGQIGPEDFGLLRDNFGMDGGPTGTYPLTSAPEPATILVLLGAVPMLARRWRNKP